MRTIKRLSAILIAVLLCALLLAPAAAYADNTYTAVEGTSTTFNKYLIMDAGDNVPNVSFSFSVASGTAISASAGKMEVMAGPGAPTIADVTFAPSDATATEAGTNIDIARQASARADGLTAETGVQLEAGEKYATKQATVSFSGITFDEPGIYRYIITETANADHESAGIMHDNDVDRVLDVYVSDDGTGTLTVAAYVLHLNANDIAAGSGNGSADVQTDGAPLDDKTDGFTNEFNSKDLVFKKEVTGNQASRDKWFAFTATVTDVNDDDVFTISLADDGDDNTTDGNADATSGVNNATIAENQNKTNPTSATGAELKAGVKFYLQHGQSVAIRGIAPNAAYTVEENAEDYKSTASGVSGYDKAATGVIGTIAGTEKVVKTSFLNTRNGMIPTGVLLTAVPGIAIVAVALGGLLAVKRKKNED